MTVDPHTIRQNWKEPWFGCCVLGAALTAIYFTLVWNANDTGQLGMSVLFFFCVGSVLQDRAKELTFHRDWLSWGIAALLLGWVLLHSSPQTDGYTLRLFPVVSGVAIALLASGWQHLRQYWRELTMFFFLGVPSFLAYHLIDISPLTAKFSALMLWYAGFDILSQGVYMALADGRAVRVVYECSGIDMMNYLMGMAIISLIMFPLSGWFNQLFVPLAGAFFGFVVNGFRVSLMVVLAKFDQRAFHNWHTGTGAYTFALLGVVMLGLLYWLLLSRTQTPAGAYASGDDSPPG